MSKKTSRSSAAKTAWGKKVDKRMNFVEKTATKLSHRAATAKRAR